MMNNTTISILGCGWFGKALALHLVGNGYVVKGSTTSSAKLEQLEEQGIRSYLVDLKNGQTEADFFSCDILVVACGPDVGALARYCSEYGVKRIIFISSTGVYGNGEVDEDSLVDNTRPHAIAEQKLGRIGLTVIRFAGLVGPGRMPGRFLAGKQDLPNGSALVNLIHLDDCIGLVENIMGRPDISLINGVSPDHPTRKVFYQLAAKCEGLPMPEFNNLEGSTKLVLTRYSHIYRYKVDKWSDWLTSHKVF